MSIHTSIKVSRKQAAAIVATAMTRDEDLKELASYVMAKYTFNNIYGLDDSDNEDEMAAHKLEVGIAVGPLK